MFVLNQLIGTLLVHPEWDEMFKIALKYSFFLISLFTFRYFKEIMDVISAAGGLNG